jgi:hypothetical protein
VTDQARAEEIVMNPVRHVRRLAAALAGLAGALLALAAAAPAALARPGPPRSWQLAQPSLHPLPPGWNKHPPLPAHTHTAAVGGMPGWQITLIATAAVLLAAALAVTVHRIRAARRRVTASTAQAITHPAPHRASSRSSAPA